MIIRQLSQTTINRIAAGEVLERPSSAVKELVENAIDAGATEIKVWIEAGGQNYIKIEDNGSGIPPNELALAVDRHTTSKLKDDDLFNINSFGFRGEALASIGSVARLKITSKTLEHDIAYSISVEGGDKQEVIPASLSINRGSIVEVRDLFFATPARLKFLKSPKSEAQQVANILERIALINPHISFVFYNDLKKVLDSRESIDHNLLNRITDLWGESFSQNLLTLDFIREDIQISGFLGLPTFNFRTGDKILIYVNNRPVKDRILQQAVKVAYQDVLPYDRFPLALVKLTLPNYEIDVNVHPAKTEVRFKDQNLIKAIIIKAIKQVLVDTNSNITSSTLSDNLINKIASSNNLEATQELQRAAHQMGLGGFRQARAAPFYQANEYHNKLSIPPASYTQVEASNISSQFNNNPNIATVTTTEHSYKELDSTSSLDTIYPLGVAKCQIGLTYIIAENEEGLVIVDQHAAHERIVYEKLKNNLVQNGIEKQQLLIPEVIHLTEAQIEVIINHQEHLLSLGFEIILVDKKIIEVKSVPSSFGEFDIQATFNDLAEDLIRFDKAYNIEQVFEHIYETLACHSSIRAGRKMNAHEMNMMLRQIENTPMAAQCNHGRPTFIKLKLKDLEQLFGR
ncbi:DNA mismatch repair endonuclease MutL [Rickettsiales endosymbiont of Stachyamoeba lipophora]|uniref:DNA mismatch repair endonuclease MutL n=1 Tax=Rickettsiales endosymbiont of Stachyamoeba lipophora TaxID=2486578 RepID=UPI0013DD9B54|nr:DNA mismatch repair endonuclease MutL [Rickettsiales endosymbiont of Stachyamoeba lipophora]